jgi:hypothetical protein
VAGTSVLKTIDAEPLPSRVTGSPTFVPSSAHWKVPVGIPTPGADTVTATVQVTDWPKTDGLGVQVIRLAVLARFTTALALAVEPLKPDPAVAVKAAVTGWVPTVSVEVANDALDETTVTGAPVLVPSTVNATVPGGVPTVAETVAVQVTSWPDAAGPGWQENASEVGVGGVVVTTTLTFVAVDATKFALPAYAAPIAWVAAVSVEVTKVAWPLPFSAIGAPLLVPSVLN